MNKPSAFKQTIRQIRGLYSINASKYSLLPFDSIPGPRPLPLIGNVWRYFPLIGEYKPDKLNENAIYNKRRYGPIVREQLTKNHTILHLFDPNDIETFFRQDSKYPQRRSHRALLKYRRDRPSLYNDGGLFSENGEKWYRIRNLFKHHLMSKNKVLSMVQKLDDMSLRVIKDIERQVDQQGSASIDNFEQIIYHWALGNSLSLFLDTNIDKLDKNLVEEFVQQLHNSLCAIAHTELYSDRWVNDPGGCKYYRMLAESQKFFHHFVENKIEEFSSAENRIENLFLRDWLQDDKIEKKDIIPFIIDLIMSGLHTISYTTVILLNHIANDETKLNSVQAELDQYSSLEGELKPDHFDQLNFLKNCLRESLRLNPVSIGTGRVATDELSIRNYRIPVGTMIIAHNQVTSRDPSIYEFPDSFQPERWFRYRTCPKDERPSPFATMPFGFGARACIGQRLAEFQVRVLAARVFEKFNLSFLGEIDTKMSLVNIIDGNVKLRFDTRSKANHQRG